MDVHVTRGRLAVLPAVAAALLMTGCTGLGAGTPTEASPSDTPAPASSPATSTPASPTSPEPPPAAPTTSATTGTPPVPISEGFDLTDPGWHDVAPPVVFRAIIPTGARLQPPTSLPEGYELVNYSERDAVTAAADYQLPGDEIGRLEVTIRENTAVPPPRWDFAIGLMSDPRQVGYSLCHEVAGVGTPVCHAFSEDLEFTANYYGMAETLSVEQVEPMLQAFIAGFAAK